MNGPSAALGELDKASVERSVVTAIKRDLPIKEISGPNRIEIFVYAGRMASFLGGFDARLHGV
jgi:hypothetical protein